MTTTATTAPSTSSSAPAPPLLHPRLARLDPSLRPPARHRSRLGLLAGTVGACLTIAFAAHAVQAPLPATSGTAARSQPRAAQALASAQRLVPLPA